VYCLFSSTSHFAVTTRLTGATRFCKYPLWALRGISIFGGYSLISKNIIGCCVSCITDKGLIIGIALLGIFFGSLLGGTSLRCITLSRYIGVSTSFLSRGQQRMDFVFALERSPLSSYLLGRVAGSVLASTSTYIIFIRAVLLCCPLLLL